MVIGAGASGPGMSVTMLPTGRTKSGARIDGAGTSDDSGAAPVLAPVL